MIIQIITTICAIACVAFIGKYIWRERRCFKIVYKDIIEELQRG